MSANVIRIWVLMGVAVTSILISIAGYAQTRAPLSADGDGETGSELSLPEPLTREAIREMVSRLSDDDVRALLLQRLDAVADAAEPRAQEPALLGGIEDYPVLLLRSLELTVTRVPTIPAAFASSYHNFVDGRGNAHVSKLLGLIAFAIGVALIGGYLANRLVHPARQRIGESRPIELSKAVLVLGRRIGLDLFVFLAFVATGALMVHVTFPAVEGDRLAGFAVLRAVAIVLLAWLASRFLLAPNRADLRLCATDDASARFLTRRLLIIVGIGVGFEAVRNWLIRYGMEPGATRFGYWPNLVVYVLIVLTLWQGRHAITSMLIGRDPNVAEGTRRFARAWPVIGMALVIAQWVIIELFVATGNIDRLSRPALTGTLLMVLLLPVFDGVIRALVGHFYPIHAREDTGMQAARLQTQRGLIRCGRILLAGGFIVVLARLWGIGLRHIAERGVGAHLAEALFGVLMIMALGYALWEFVNIVINRKLAIERATLGVDEHADEPGGEGAGSGSRIITLLPIFKRVLATTIVLLAALAILSEFGVNITPLLAGAGVIGLAVGFGAQTLVKDIVSGVFFLVDDAFRVGEYIDVEGTVGTVEKISVRSLRLRHHRGALHTIPYGEIPKLTNYSRDWVIVKLKFRVPFDTDINKVKKIFKQIGKDMLSDPEIGEDFLQPFKSQGVLEVDDSGMVVRGKFMAKPGKQFMIQRQVYVLVQKAFEENGIEFARKQVMVHVPDLEDMPNATQGAFRNTAAAAAQSAIEDEIQIEGRTPGD